MGAVVVPMLPEFTTEEIQNILDHSEAKVLFISSALRTKHACPKGKYLETCVQLDDFTVVESKNNIDLDLNYLTTSEFDVKEEDLAAIIYTSGTTGKSKGVMLTHKNICSNAIAGGMVQPVDHNDRFLSILPLSHTYENTLGFVLAIINGSQVFYIKKLPTPSVLTKAMKDVRPTMMLTVPLIIEKIYRNKIAPTFQKSRFMKALYAIGPVRKRLNLIAGKKLMKTFGGELKFFGIGGAKLDGVVEKFLIEAKFPYAIGYGLTETSPLSAGVSPQTVRLQSTGPSVNGVEIKLMNQDRKTGEGEIWIKGPNVMKGYYKEPELTKEVMTDDGWFKTGDLAVLDKDNFVFIKGRSKNVIVGSSGENIYPEEIESVINNFKHVVESVVVEQKGKLVALVHINRDELEKRYAEMVNDLEDRIEDLLAELHEHVNERVNKFSQLQSVVLHPVPFEKTATQKIKRFLYT
jgi:long-chain acyl-CoA synthetase